MRVFVTGASGFIGRRLIRELIRRGDRVVALTRNRQNLRSSDGERLTVVEGDPTRVALEAYPGLLARELIGARSYKSDAVAKQTAERLIAWTRNS